MRPASMAWLLGLAVAAGCHHEPCSTAEQCAAGDDLGQLDAAREGVSSGKSCPGTTLSTALPLTYHGDTTGKANLVTSARLEWGDAPDDALLFVAPQAGTYTLAMPSAPSTNQGCGASAQDYGSMSWFTESTCPAAGAVGTLDGVYAATGTTTSDVALSQGQHLLIWVSCTTWSTAKAGPYTLTITKK